MKVRVIILNRINQFSNSYFDPEDLHTAILVSALNLTDTKAYDFTSQMRIATDDNTESTNDSYINGLILLFCKNLEMKVTQLSVQEKETLRNIFSRSKPAK